MLLTAYADTEAAIKAINEVRLDHYLMKPWHPPEELLYPVLDDLLDDWRANFQPPFEGVRIIGHRWSADGHRIRDFLARNLIPYRWLDIETDPEAAELRELAGAGGGATAGDRVARWHSDVDAEHRRACGAARAPHRGATAKTTT